MTFIRGQEMVRLYPHDIPYDWLIYIKTKGVVMALPQQPQQDGVLGQVEEANLPASSRGE